MESLIEHRRALHRIPELDDRLEETCAYVRAALEKLPCQILSPIPGALCAWFDGGKKDALAFRADLDALPVEEKTGLPFTSRHPGNMHACGHDGHTAMVLALAEYVAQHLTELPHNVLLIFQPSEETTGGAKCICDSGVFERFGARAVFGIHLWPGLPAGELYTCAGPMMARSREVTLCVAGKSVHISNAEQGADALWAASLFLQQVYEAERTALPPECRRLLKFGRMESGTVRNAVSDHTLLEGSLRTFREADDTLLRRRCEEIAAAVAAQTQCKMELSFSEGYPPVTNDERLVNLVKCQVDGVHDLDVPALTTEDFSWYQTRLPGVFFFLGVGQTEPLHSPRFSFDETLLQSGVALYEKLLYLPLP